MRSYVVLATTDRPRYGDVFATIKGSAWPETKSRILSRLYDVSDNALKDIEDELDRSSRDTEHATE